MGVDAFLVADVDLEAGDARVAAQGHGGAAGGIFHKGGLLVGLHRDVAFVRALQ